MPTKPQIRQTASSAPPSEGDETRLLAEIERLQQEVNRLGRQLVEERADHCVQAQVNTVLSELYCSPTVDPDDGCRTPSEVASRSTTVGRELEDGRFVPGPTTVGGTSRAPEVGAPRVQATAVAVVEPVVIPDLDDAELASADPFEFAVEHDSDVAFDQFFTAPDPGLEKIRRFLLG